MGSSASVAVTCVTYVPVERSQSAYWFDSLTRETAIHSLWSSSLHLTLMNDESQLQLIQKSQGPWWRAVRGGVEDHVRNSATGISKLLQSERLVGGSPPLTSWLGDQMQSVSSLRRITSQNCLVTNFEQEPGVSHRDVQILYFGQADMDAFTGWQLHVTITRLHLVVLKTCCGKHFQLEDLWSSWHWPEWWHLFGHSTFW